MTLSTIFMFLGASIALTVAPGPDNVFVVTQGVSRGRKAAIVTAWGMCSGLTVHTVAAAAGISAVFYSSALAFQAVKFAGAAYLLYLAWQALSEHGPLRLSEAGAGSWVALFRRGFIMNVLNPKVALFFLAFLPQFTSREAGSIPVQMLLLGAIFMVQALVIFTAIGFCSGSLGNWILKRPQAGRCFSWLAAAIFASLGVRLAFVQR
ncbi:homoserine/homoserine lactone efflux protein [Geobacter sp. OR-1]|uniref:LysE family translocator n=1 Tax=Geobacter sp. OR-1 TaxID=1266765 RepID=UPI000541A5C3|nr:LysE family translocator [Geobacter sp. OR-1]GAM11208.1 homoserine/homoserine lactone efflux protein [Geobacter sp. OR-1]